MNFTITLAGHTIRIESLYDEIYRMCRDYLSRGTEPELTVSIRPADIEAEQERSAKQDLREGRQLAVYPDAYLETLAVYRQIADAMPERGVFLLHGSAVAVGERGWIFTAPSGVGKTTHTKLWLDNIEGSYVVNGDKPLICRTDSGFQVCGTPWAGKEGWNRNTAVSLQGIVYLQRGAENRITRVSAGEILPLLISQTYRPSDVEAQKASLALLQAACGELAFYKLACNMEPDAAYTAFRGLTLHAAS